jgi:hypothetical protein
MHSNPLELCDDAAHDIQQGQQWVGPVCLTC